MIGLPFQTHENLVSDLLFFQKEDVDMIGMGPYIPHTGTPLGWPDGNYDPTDHFRLGLVMIALARLTLRDVNIAAATALQTLDPEGREKGIAAGANIIMPNSTPTAYRKFYQLYDNKPCLEENARQCRSCLEKRICGAGDEVGYGEWGDSPHFQKRHRDLGWVGMSLLSLGKIRFLRASPTGRIFISCIATILLLITPRILPH